MNKVIAKRRIQTLLASKGLSATYTTGRIADRIAIKNKKGKCVASGTIKLDSSKKGYKDADLSATLKAMRSLNCTADFEGEDAEFIEDAELIVEDENGNTIDVGSMLVVQDLDSNEISLWVPEKGETENDLPPTVTVIGVVSEPLDPIDSDTLNSSRSDVTRKTLKEEVLDKGFVMLDSVNDTFYYVVVKANDDNIEMTEKFKNQLLDEGLYDDSFIGVVTDRLRDLYPMDFFPIYGERDRYATKWFKRTPEEVIDSDLKDRNMKLLARANKYLASLSTNSSRQSNKLNSAYSGEDFNTQDMMRLLPGSKINAIRAVAVECGDGTGGFIV